MQKSLKHLLCGCLRNLYPELWAFCQMLLILSRGQASVEGGFFVNKEAETVNIQEDMMVAHRLVCDLFSQYGGVTLEKKYILN